VPLITADNFSQYVRIAGEEHLRQAKQFGRGVIVVTAHYGFWDVIPLYFAFNRLGANFITKHIRNESLNAFWMEYRRYGGVNPIFKKESAREIITVLNRNECLGFVVDQNMNERSGVFVDFFGVKACTVDAPAKLALHHDSPVLPLFCVREPDDTFTIHIEKPIPVLEGATKEETIVRTTQEYTRALERYIIEHPDHWIWMHKRWKTRPNGEAKIY
jgi:KDO2-lipid IV(A) lauroyltransferase